MVDSNFYDQCYLISEYYCDKEYSKCIELFKKMFESYEMADMLDGLHRYNSLTVEIYLFSLLRNRKDFKFGFSFNFQRIYKYFNSENNSNIPTRKLYISDDLINFGLHKGSSIEEIVKTNPSYIFWCIENIGGFYVSPEILFEIMSKNESFSLDTVELNILKKDFFIKHNFMKGLGIHEIKNFKPWEIEIEKLKNVRDIAFMETERYNDEFSSMSSDEYKKHNEIFESACQILLLYHHIE